MYESLGIRVDQIIQGMGTSNTGNLARRCFAEPEKFAKALEIDEHLICNVATIITAFKCKKPLNLDKLEKFAIATNDLHFYYYPWARMNPSLHKLLIHGCQIARKFPLPMAYFSEDAVESMHKFYRDWIKNRSRQNSRLNRILDTFNNALYYSDPKISLSNIEDRIEKINSDLPVEVQNFIE